MGAIARTVLLFVMLMAIFSAIGYIAGVAFAGSNWIYGLLFFLILAALINAISYFFASKLVLWSYRAKIVSEAEAPRLHRIVRYVAQMGNRPIPRVAIVPLQTPNAFATGRSDKDAVVAATEGLLSLLSDEELEGVIAHELSHIKNRDILVMSVAATIAGAIAFAARMLWYNSMFSGGRRDTGLLLLIVGITAPIAALLVQLAISRGREYHADRTGATMIGRPLQLASALQKLEAAVKRRPIERGNPASSSLFIVNPFRGGGLVSIFSTHPPVAERVRRLKALAHELGRA